MKNRRCAIIWRSSSGLSAWRNPKRSRTRTRQSSGRIAIIIGWAFDSSSWLFGTAEAPRKNKDAFDSEFSKIGEFSKINNRSFLYYHVHDLGPHILRSLSSQSPQQTRPLFPVIATSNKGPYAMKQISPDGDAVVSRMSWVTSNNSSFQSSRWHMQLSLIIELLKRRIIINEFSSSK